MEKLYTVSKNKTGSWLWLRSWTPYCQIITNGSRYYHAMSKTGIEMSPDATILCILYIFLYSWNLWHPFAQFCFQPWKFLSGKELLKSLTLQYESVAMTSSMDICLPVQFSCSVVSDSLRPHEPQHGRPPCPSPTPRVDPNPCPSSQWCHPTISSSVIPFSSCPPSFPASGSFPVS